MKKTIFFLAVLFLCINIIAAAETNVQVKTVPFKNVNVLVLSANLEVYDKFNKNSDKYGDVLFTFSLDNPYFDMTIFVKDLTSGDKVAYTKLENQNTGEDIYVEVIPDNFEIIETPEPEPEINESLVLENETTEEMNETQEIQGNSERKSKISGKVIFGKDSTLKKILLYAGGIILLAIIIFFVRKFIKSRGSKKIKITKLSELKQGKQEEKQEREEKIDDYKEAIEDAQKKIKEAQDEINKLRNRDKIKEMEKRIEDEQRELRKLKGE